MTRLLAPLLIAALGCTPDAATDGAAAAPTDDTGTPLLDTGPPSAPAALMLDDWVLALEGDWSGQARDTPLGDLPFAITFIPDGDTMVGSAALPGFGLTFTFTPTDDGWTFHERGELGPMVQEHDLAPVWRDGDTVRWEHDDPSYLTVEGTADGDVLMLDVQIRGESHATLDLSRAR